MESVVLVNEFDEVLGSMEKMEAHLQGVLHRAFSIFILSEAGEILLQQRALEKYHSGGLWTNACCSHPRLNETTVEAGKRRLQEELGFSCELTPAFHFIYKVALDNDLMENELDHVLIGTYSKPFTPNPDEVMDTKWISLNQLKEDISANPSSYTAWIRIIMANHFEELKTSISHENHSRRKL